jgi:predicted transglutaminase-like cysteine proteinase
MSEEVDVLNDTFRTVRELFRWRSDKKTLGVDDEWHSSADRVRTGDIFTDDCDGFALTCGEILTEDRGIPAGNVEMAICRTETGEVHMVCIASGWVLDNRQRRVIAWNRLKYEWIMGMKISEPGVWREMAS